MFDVLWIMIFNPRGPKGVALQPNAKLYYSQADIIGLRVACLKMLIVNSVCANRLSHIYLGKSGSTPARISRKCALNVLISLSAIFLMWTLGGTS